MILDFRKMIVVLTCAAALSGCKEIDRLAFEVIYPWKIAEIRYPTKKTPPSGVEQIDLEVELSNQKMMRIHTWFYRGANPANDVIVYFHGKGETLESVRRKGLIKMFQDVEKNFVMISYPGLGRSTNSPNEDTTTRAGVAAVDFARTLLPSSRLIVWGRSFGTGVAMQVANLRQSEIDRLILVTPWDTLKNVAIAMTPVAKQISRSWWSRHTYDSVAVAREFVKPTLIFHGDRDKTIPISQAINLHNSFPAANSTFHMIKGKGHPDIGYQDPELWNVTLNWLRQ